MCAEQSEKIIEWSSVIAFQIKEAIDKSLQNNDIYLCLRINTRDKLIIRPSSANKYDARVAIPGIINFVEKLGYTYIMDRRIINSKTIGELSFESHQSVEMSAGDLACIKENCGVYLFHEKRKFLYVDENWYARDREDLR